MPSCNIRDLKWIVLWPQCTLNKNVKKKSIYIQVCV